MSNAIANRPLVTAIQPAIPLEPARFAAERRRKLRKSSPVRRRSTREQGRALEILAHAVEYLVDSRLSLVPETRSDELAVQMLMRLNREVFAECAEVVSLKRRLLDWLGW